MSDVFAAAAPAVVPPDHGSDVECDVAIIGAGVGGATLAWALRESGARVLVLEQGDFLPRERENWSPRAIHGKGRYKNSAKWFDGDGDEFQPGTYHYVGGSSKLYGATMPRLREHDFGAVELRDGTSPAWPIGYDDLEPYYGAAEKLYWVHGGGDEDPTEPRRSNPYPFPAVPHDPAIARVADGFAKQGLHPFALPQAVDWRAGGRCVLCDTCDSYACMVDAKGDADVCAMRPALESPNVKLMTKAEVRRIVTGPGAGLVERLEVSHGGRERSVRAARYVVAGGAVNSASLLLRSGGVANSSDQVGRNYMAHLTTFIIGSRPGRDLEIQYEKTLGLNDWYEAGPETPYPLGNVQGLGKLFGETIKPAKPWAPKALLSAICRRSVDFLAQSEDLPRAENRVEVDSAGRIHLYWEPTGRAAHGELVEKTRRAIRRAGFPFIFTQSLGIVATSHQCGTARMGEDPATSVVRPDLRSHDLDNLWIVDGSVFPSSAAVNPALTIAALALRAAEHGGLA